MQPELVYYQLDHLGTPIAAHNAKGEAVWTAEYEAWGRIRNIPFQTASKSISRSASKVSITTKKAGCTTTVSAITTLKSGGL
ncbi:TPA: RHS domain-containing protein [Neisseria subflava]